MNLTNRNSYFFRLFVAVSLLTNAIFGGYAYESAEIGVFRSRLSPAELKTEDEQRGEEAVELLKQYTR